MAGVQSQCRLNTACVPPRTAMHIPQPNPHMTTFVSRHDYPSLEGTAVHCSAHYGNGTVLPMHRNLLPSYLKKAKKQNKNRNETDTSKGSISGSVITYPCCLYCLQINYVTAFTQLAMNSLIIRAVSTKTCGYMRSTLFWLGFQHCLYLHNNCNAILL